MTLRELVANAVTKNGKMGKEKLALKAGLSPSLVANVLNGHAPLPKNAYQLALACGCTDEEALELSKGSSLEATDTA
jgi:transcriptional regulator with XRE-family HTH domain